MIVSKLTESIIEDLAIKLFERLGHDDIHAPDRDPATRSDEGEVRA